MSKRERDFNSDQAGKFARRGLSTLQKAQVASYKFNKLHPWPTHGAARIPRGSEWSRANFGQTYKSANAEQREMRKASGFTGRGKYGLRDSVGSFLKKKKFASTMYDKAMDYAGMGLYTGRGLYSSNNLVEMQSARPSMEFSSPNDETQSLIISHKEYVGDVFAPSTAAFTNTTYNINPGLQQNFPFLAQFAQNFDEYELIQMVFEFHSTIDASATNNTAGNTGTIVMATNYKADSPSFMTKEEMIQYHGGVSGRLTENLTHGVECDPSKNALGGGKFIRTQVVANSDLKTFDMGTFQLALQNIPTPFFNQQVGELWVYYKVKLSKPKLFTALGNGIAACRLLSSGGESINNLMGTNVLRAQANTFDCTVANVNKSVVITFPAALSGVYEIKMFVEGTTLANAGTVGPLVAGNVGGFTDIYSSAFDATDGPVYYTFSTSGVTTIMVIRITLKAATAGVNNTLTIFPLGTTGTAVSITQSSIEIMEVGSSLSTSNTVQAPIWLNSSNVVTNPSAA